MAEAPAGPPEISSFKKNYNRARAILRSNMYRARDFLAPQIAARWAFSAFLLVTYLLRIWLHGGFYIITYALGIYLLNLIVIFLMPQLELEEEESEGLLPTRADDEFRPFMRKLPEFRFWYVSGGYHIFLTRVGEILLLALDWPFSPPCSASSICLFSGRFS